MATTKLPSFVVVLLALLGCEEQSLSERMDDTQGDTALSEEEPSFADAGGGGDGAAPSNPKAPTVAELCAPPTNPASGGLTTPRPEPECMGKACGDSCDPCVGLQPGVCETIPKGDYACNVWGGCFLVTRDPNDPAPDASAPVESTPLSVAELCAPPTNPASGGLTTPRPEPECMGKACGDSCDPCVGLQPGVCETIPKGDYACNVWGGCFLVKKQP